MNLFDWFKKPKPEELCCLVNPVPCRSCFTVHRPAYSKYCATHYPRSYSALYASPELGLGEATVFGLCGECQDRVDKDTIVITDDE